MLGHHTGVASLFGLSFSGLPAWFMWRAVYLAKLPRISKKVRVGIDWMLDMLFGRDISALPTSGTASSPDLTPTASSPPSS
jgi:NADH dehydrogenase